MPHVEDELDRGAGVSVRTLHTLVARLTSSGVDAARLLEEAGVDPADLRDPRARVPHTRIARVWQRAVEVTGDAHLAVRALEVVHPLQIELLPDVTEYLMVQLVACSVDVRQAFDRLARYYAIVDDVARVTLENGPGTAVTLAFRFPAPASDVRPYVEFSVGVWSRVLRGAMASPSVGLAVTLRGPAPPPHEVAAYQRALGGDVRFDAPRDGIVVEARDLDARLRSARPALAEHLDRRAAEAVAELGAGTSLARRVRGVLRERVRHGAPTAQHTARRLGTSVRTLSRRLSEEGTSHGALLDEVRAELARQHLADPALASADIASLLGFSDSTTFHRAFRRWFGCTPAELRAREAQRR